MRRIKLSPDQLAWIRDAARAERAWKQVRSTLGAHRALAAARQFLPRMTGKSTARRDESTNRVLNVARWGRKKW